MLALSSLSDVDDNFKPNKFTACHLEQGNSNTKRYSDLRKCHRFLLTILPT